MDGYGYKVNNPLPKIYNQTYHHNDSLIEHAEVGLLSFWFFTFIDDFQIYLMNVNARA